MRRWPIAPARRGSRGFGDRTPLRQRARRWVSGPSDSSPADVVSSFSNEAGTSRVPPRSRLNAASRAPLVRLMICPLTNAVTHRWPFSGRHELRVFLGVAGVSAHDPAPCPAAEDPKPRAVRPPTDRLRVPSDEPQLLFLDSPAEQAGSGVSADEAVQVARSRDDPSGCSRVGGAERPRGVLGRMRRVAPVAVEVRLRHRRPATNSSRSGPAARTRGLSAARRRWSG